MASLALQGLLRWHNHRMVGYGFSWEAAEPIGAHLLASVVAQSWLETQAQPPLPDVVLHPQKVRQVLLWLSQTHALQCIHVLSAQEAAFIAAGNPPGHQMSGTQGWQWRGGLFLPHCPPLNDVAILTLAIALPADEPLDLAGLVHLWQELAALAAQGHIAGEEEAQ